MRPGPFFGKGVAGGTPDCLPPRGESLPAMHPASTRLIVIAQAILPVLEIFGHGVVVGKRPDFPGNLHQQSGLCDLVGKDLPFVSERGSDRRRQFGTPQPVEIVAAEVSNIGKDNPADVVSLFVGRILNIGGIIVILAAVFVRVGRSVPLFLGGIQGSVTVPSVFHVPQFIAPAQLFLSGAFPAVVGVLPFVRTIVRDIDQAVGIEFQFP